jgi:hypothetical protein
MRGFDKFWRDLFRACRRDANDDVAANARTGPTDAVHAGTVDNQDARRAVASWRGPEDV